MSAYQLDECVNWTSLAESCSREKLVDIHRFPKTLVSRKDIDVLEFVFEKNHTLLTTDRKIHLDHVGSIHKNHPGILILAHFSPIQTATRKSIIGTLGCFKLNFPAWPNVSLRNSVVEVTEQSVEVWRIVDARVDGHWFIGFAEDDWQNKLTEILRKNADSFILSD